MKEVMAYSTLAGSLQAVHAVGTKRSDSLPADENCCSAALAAVLVVT